MMSQTKQATAQSEDRGYADGDNVHRAAPPNPFHHQSVREEYLRDGHHRAMHGTDRGQPHAEPSNLAWV